MTNLNIEASFLLYLNLNLCLFLSAFSNGNFFLHSDASSDVICGIKTLDYHIIVNLEYTFFVRIFKPFNNISILKVVITTTKKLIIINLQISFVNNYKKFKETSN